MCLRLSSAVVKCREPFAGYLRRAAWTDSRPRPYTPMP